MSKKTFKKISNSCQICTKVAVGYHYGAYVCEACKKFFIRHSSGTCRQYGRCQESGTCDLAINGRGKCQHCRIKRCNDVGMNISYKSSDYNLCVIPCQVCGAKSSGLHFGCITCEGCKGFFRRMMEFKGLLVCFNGNKCKLESNSRSLCKSCRMERCILIGMSRKGIRIGRHPNSLKYDCINSLTSEKPNRYVSAINFNESPGETHSRISSPDNDKIHLSDTENIGDDKSNPDTTESGYNENDNSISEELSVVLNDTDLQTVISTEIYNGNFPLMFDRDLLLELEEHIIQIINNVSPSLLFLAQKEQGNNAERNDFVGSESSQTVWSSMMDHFMFHSHFIVKFAKLIPGFSKLSHSDKKIVIKYAMYPMILLELSQEYSERNGEISFNYFDFSTTDREIILEFFPEFIEFSNHLKSCGSIKYLLKLNAVEMTLVCGIIMFFNYDCLSDSGLGRSMMSLYQGFLMVYFKSKLGFSTNEADDRMKLCLQFVKILQDMNSSHHRIINNFCISHNELQYPDLYIEIFNN